MTKKVNWLECLYSTIEENANKEFIWGKFDCCLFTADCIIAMTGEDYAKPYRGRYKTKRGAFMQLRKHTGKSNLLDAMTHIMGGIEGVIEVNPALRQKGDLAIVELPESGDSFGVVMNGAILFPSEDGGLNKVNITPKKVWRIK